MAQRLFPIALSVSALAAAVACSELKYARSGEEATTEAGDDAPDPISSDDDARAPDPPGLGAADAAGGPSPEASADAGRTTGSTGLDNDVVLPNLSEPACDRPGSVSCGGVRACRMATPDSGRCDDCGPTDGRCSQLVTEPCVRTLDCDVDLQCFRGKCTLTCLLPEGAGCGGLPEDCIDVGYEGYGLCDPDELF